MRRPGCAGCLTTANPVPRQAAHLFSILPGLVCFIFPRENPSGSSGLMLDRIRHSWISIPCRAELLFPAYFVPGPDRFCCHFFSATQSGPNGAGEAELGRRRSDRRRRKQPLHH